MLIRMLEDWQDPTDRHHILTVDSVHDKPSKLVLQLVSEGKGERVKGTGPVMICGECNLEGKVSSATTGERIICPNCEGSVRYPSWRPAAA